MCAGREIVPQAYAARIGFELRIDHGIFESHLLVNGDEVAEEQGVETAVLVVGPHGDEHEVNDFGAVPVECVEHVNPSQREEAAVGALQGPCHGRHGDGRGHQLARVGFLNDAYHVQVD